MNPDSLTRTQYQTGKPLEAALNGMTSLIGCTVTLVMVQVTRDDEAPAANKIDNAPVTIVDPVARTVRYDWQPEDVDTAGVFRLVFWVEYADGKFDPVPDEDGLAFLTFEPAPSHP